MKIMNRLFLFLVVTSFTADLFAQIAQNVEKVGSYPLGRTLSVIGQDNMVYLNSGGIIRKIDISHAGKQKIVKEIITDAAVTSLYLDDKYLYAANSKAGFKILDRENLELISSLNTQGTVYGLFVKLPYLYLADGQEGLKIIDVSDLKEPKLIGGCVTRGNCRDVLIRDNLAYVADAFSGVTIIDVANPCLPTIIKNYDTKGCTYKLDMHRNYLFLADGEKVRILDVSDLNSIEEISSYEPGVAPLVTDLEFKEDFLYLAYNDFGFIILEVKDLANPKEVYRFPMKVVNLFLNKDCVYLNGAEYGWAILDIKNRNASRPVFSTFYGRNYAITAKDKTVYVNGDCTINAVNTGVYPPQIMRTLPTEDSVLRLLIKDNYLYCANAKAGLKIIDPQSLEIISSYKTEGTVYDFFIKLPYIYLADGREGIKILNIEDVKRPKLVSKIKTNGVAKDIFLSDKYLFVADDGFGVSIVDISDTNSAKIVSTYTENKNINKVVVSGNYLYSGVCGKDFQRYGYGRHAQGALEILDVSDIKSPKRVSIYPIPPIALHMYYWSTVSDIHVEDTICYLACGEGGFVLLDVSKPEEPKVLSIFGTCFPLSFCIDENYAYLANGENGWDIIDVQEPNNPRGIFHTDWQTVGLAKGITVYKNYALLCTLGGGIHIIDVSNPRKPEYVSNIYQGSGVSVKIKGAYLYVMQGTGHGNIYVHDLSDLKSPKFIGFWPGMGRPEGICCLDKNYLYIAAYRNLIKILDISDPKNLKEVSSCANGYGRSGYVKDNYGYFHGQPFEIWDLGEIESPKHLSTFTDPSILDCHKIMVRDNYAYLAASEFCILDISDRKNVKMAGKANVDAPYDLDIQGNFAYVVDLFKGIRIFDISDPSQPKEVGFYPSGGCGPWEVCYRDGYIYVADGEAGLSILRFTEGKFKEQEEKQTVIGMSRSSLKGAGVKWYYNGLIGKPYGFVEAQRGAGGAPHTVLGVFDQTCMDTYIPFFGLSRNEGLIGCGINPRQKVTCQTDVSGKITPMGTR